MTYEIKLNTNFNSLEVYFEGKPAEAIRTALKALKMRWNPKKGCWYGFADREEIDKACKGEKVTTKAPAKKAAKKNKYGVKVGDIFEITWGYEQTNVDFFQVIALVGETSVKIREVNPPIIKEEATGPMAADRTYKIDTTEILPPSPYSVFINDQENGDIKRISDKYTNQPHFTVGKGGYLATLITGDTYKTYESWYY